MLTTFRLTKINMQKRLKTVSFCIPYIIAFTAIYEFAYPLKNMAMHYSFPINGFSAAFLFTNINSVLIIFVGVLIMFSALPFNDNHQFFLISRSGKMSWIFSQVLFVFFNSLIYVVFIFLCFCIVLFPYLEFETSSWGRIIRTIASTNATQIFELRFTVPQSVLSDFSPLNSFLYSFTIVFFISNILGLVILLFNLTLKQSSGTVVSGFIIFFYMYVYMGGHNTIKYYFSPLNWCSIYIVDINNVSAFPNISWIIAAICTCLVVEIISLYICGVRKSKLYLEFEEEIK